MKHVFYPSLDGLRAIAVGIVLAAHGGVPWFRSGGVGVDIFFVLSGFLITSILAAETAETGGIGLRNFYARRFLRLTPCLLVTCAFVAVTFPLFEKRFPSTELMLALTYTSNWALALFGYHLTWLNHCWSLAIEEQFYLLWPWVVWLLHRAVHAPWQKCAGLVMFALGIATYRALMVGNFSDDRINFGLDTRMDTLAMGAALAYLVRALPGARLSPLSSLLVGRFLAPCALLGLFCVPQIVTWYSPWMGWIGYLLVSTASAIVIADLVAGSHSLLVRALSWAPLRYVGRISYGVYLLHLPVYYMVEHVIGGAPLIVRLSWKIVLSLLIAAASYHFIERHFLRLKSRFERKPLAPSRQPQDWRTSAAAEAPSR
jgi:peptidoglycan/LPS O-acetylase OafA/YrhL